MITATLNPTQSAADLVDQSMIQMLANVFIMCGGLPYEEDFTAKGFDNIDYLVQRKWISRVPERKQFAPVGEVQAAYRKLMEGF